MPCASALSAARDSGVAISQVLDRVAEGLGGAPADLALVFSSLHHAASLERLAAEIRARGLGRHVLGCTGESIIGDDQEVEDSVALSLWSIALPGIDLKPVRFSFEEGRYSGGPIGSGTQDSAPTLLFLGDPFTFPADEWLKQVNASGPNAPKVVGGMASGGQTPGLNRLILDECVYGDGAVGISVASAAAIRTVVSQGCRPIGRPMIVTRADGNIIRDLGRRPALEVLQEQFAELEPDDQTKVQQGLHIGRVINEYQEVFKQGDFLVRNVIGADDAGGIAITDVVRVGQTVQFHVRDAETADQDLRAMVASELRPNSGPAATGALLFTCNGRGTRLFAEPNHDVGVLHELLGPIPVAGFFAMGELGPVGGQNFLHGYTASVVLFPPMP